jgi:siroheme synthase-like protein
VSGYPLLVEGARLRALVVGGGRVAARKTHALLAAGAVVRVVSPRIEPWLHAAASATPERLAILERAYRPGDVGDATLVIVATDSREVNAAVARDGHAAHRLVNVVDVPAEGNCATVAAHRAGALVVGVSAGGMPAAAARIRDELARRFDGRYAAALRELAALRGRLLGAGRRATWREALDDLVSEDFCAAVEGGTFDGRLARWR